MPASKTLPSNNLAQSQFSLPSQADKPRFVQSLFERLAGVYDVMNDIMTAGLHRHWKRVAELALRVPDDGVILDLCCGTGDLALAIQQHNPEAMVMGLDFSPNMLDVANERARKAKLEIHFETGDALHLPYGDEQFDGVIQAYGLRNVADYDRCLAEVYRVLKPGGRYVILDMSHPHPPISWLSHVYRFHILPLVGRLIARDDAAYRYLTNSIFFFPTQDELIGKLTQTGFTQAGYRNFVGGVCALHWGCKPI